MTAEKRTGQGFTFLVAYTASKTINNTSSQFAPFNGLAINTYDRKAERSLCGCDLPKNLVVSALYELPIGPGKRFLSKGGASGKLTGGWRLTLINSYQSGTPLSIGGGPALPLFNGGNRPNVVSNQPIVSWQGGKFDPAVDKYLNPAAFVDPAQFQIGNAPRTEPTARSFPLYNENIGLIKETPINESARIEFRAEFFNAFNRVEFGGPNTFIDFLPGYGRIGYQANSPRQIQFALKFIF
jgi:hypothetical protein